MELAARTGAWSGNPESAYGGLCFTAQSANSSVQLTKVGSSSALSVTLQKSTDGVNWSAYTVGDVLPLASVGDKVYLAAGPGGNSGFASSTSTYHKFVLTGKVAASGDMTSLLDLTLAQKPLISYCYYRMFLDCTSLATAPELPATTLTDHCYREMFLGCTSLVTAPELPATTLTTYCYYYMFKGCTSLVAAPELPATTLASHCYRYMFSGCASLASTPELPATTLADYCYNNMFKGCTSLVAAPELPATTLASYCYRQMFEGCTSLVSTPELPATTLANYCYNSMFKGCTSLVTAPELHATDLGDFCCGSMFDGCTSLRSIKVHFTAWGTNRTNSWVTNIPSGGTFYKPSALSTEYGNNRIPTGWTVVDI